MLIRRYLRALVDFLANLTVISLVTEHIVGQVETSKLLFYIIMLDCSFIAGYAERDLLLLTVCNQQTPRVIVRNWSSLDGFDKTHR